MDYQAVGVPTNYGAPLVFGQNGQQNQQNSQLTAALQKAKQLLSSGQISAAQYNQITSQFTPQTELVSSAGNMGAGMPGATGAPLNILPAGA